MHPDVARTWMDEKVALPIDHSDFPPSWLLLRNILRSILKCITACILDFRSDTILHPLAFEGLGQ